MNKKVLGIAVVLMSVVMLASVLSTVEACGCRRKKPKVMDFVLHIENVVRVDDNVVWYTDTGESGTGTPPDLPPEGTMELVVKGFQFVLQGAGTYLQLDDAQIPLAPEDYKCNYDVIQSYDVEFPVLFELEYFVRERITFNSAGFKGWLSIFSYETGPGIYNPDSPFGVDLEVSGTCCGYGMINGRFVTLKGERNLTLLKKCAEKDIGIKIMAPITGENFEVANQLSKHFEVKHVPVSYLKTTIVDGKYLFQSKITSDKKETPLHFQNPFYTNDYRYVENMEKILQQLWKTSRAPSKATLESVTNTQKSTLKNQSTPHYTYKRIDAPAIVEEEKLSEKLTEKEIFDLHIKAQRNPNTAFSGGITRTYGHTGHAIIHPPSKLNLPELFFIFIHFEKYSRFGAEDVLQILVGQDTPSGHSYCPLVFIADNPNHLDFQSKALAGLFPKGKFQLAEKDQIQVQMHGNHLFCGWTMEIPLTQKYTLPPGSILLEGYGDVKPNILEMQYPSGYKLWNAYNGLEAFVTYFHPSSKYSGPGTEGFIFRDTVMDMYPPEKRKSEPLTFKRRRV